MRFIRFVDTPVRAGLISLIQLILYTLRLQDLQGTTKRMSRNHRAVNGIVAVEWHENYVYETDIGFRRAFLISVEPLNL